MSQYFWKTIGSVFGRLGRQGLASKRKPGNALQQLEQLEARIALDADGGIHRPLLEVSQTVRLDGTDVGPSPFIFEKQAIVGDKIASYVVTKVANGVVEKWDESTQAWLDISERPKSSNPRELLSLLRKRMFSEGDRLRWVPGNSEGVSRFRDAVKTIAWSGTDSPARAVPGDVTEVSPGPVNAMMQADTGYSTDVSDDILQSMPERFLFRVKGPSSSDRIAHSDLIAFADRIKSWEGSLCYSPDVDHNDTADWHGFNSSKPYEVYVDDLKSLNALLKQAGTGRQFDEIVIETEGSTLGGSPEVYQDMRTYMNTKGMNAITIGATVGWTKIDALPVDHTYVELYNIYAHDPVTGKELVDGNQSPHLCSPNGCLPGLGQGSIYQVMNPTDAADQIVEILKLKYPNFSTLFDGLLNHTYFLFSYEPQFLGVSSPPALQPWNADNYSAFINRFISQAKAEGLTDQTLLTGVYQAAPAFKAWYGE